MRGLKDNELKPTQEQVIAWARESGDCLTDKRGRKDFIFDCYGIERLAALAYEAGRKDENEACAALCDAHKNPIDDPTAPVGQYESGGYIMAEFLADAIRARGSDA